MNKLEKALQDTARKVDGAYGVMLGQAGQRMIATFDCLDDDGRRVRYTSHYTDQADIERAAREYRARYVHVNICINRYNK